MKIKKIPVLIICAVLAASLAACALFGAKTPADGDSGGIAEETTSAVKKGLFPPASMADGPAGLR